MRRIFVSMAAVVLFISAPSLAQEWIQYASRNIPAPTGTVMLPTLSVILGIQILLSAIGEDLRSVPREPLCDGPLAPLASIAEMQQPSQTAASSPHADAAPAYADAAKPVAAALVQGSMFKVQS